MINTKTLNLNVGVLGHVDSGKTSLAKVLSTISSTASFDKNPQSQARGITIDLGFSSFIVNNPTSGNSKLECDKLQFTLVDCPGHASLIRTVIGGKTWVSGVALYDNNLLLCIRAQIIDMVMLVIDVTKGMQTQTAECLIIAEITCDKMIIVLNKIDILPETKRLTMIEKMTKKMKLTLANTVFKDAPIVSVAANPGAADNSDAIGIKELIEALSQFAFIPQRDVSAPFLYCVDHCFSIRGQGTVMTGTVLQGAVKINDTVEIPSIRVSKKVKSMQMFRQPMEQATAGDRLGLCVTQFDPKLLERGIVCAPGYATTISAAIISIKKIKYFKGNVNTKARFHVSIGHETIMAKITIFSGSVDTNISSGNENEFNFDTEYKYHDELLSSEGGDELLCKQYALLEFEKPLLAVPQSLVIGSKLDIDIHTNTCRLAFSGRLLNGLEDKTYVSSVLPNLKVYKNKLKTGFVERMVNECEVIVKHLFKKETNVQLFVGLKVQLSTGEFGTIESSFGQSGKVKVRIQGGMKASTITQLSNCLKKKGKPLETNDHQTNEFVQIMLTFKRYLYDPQKKIIQI